MTLLNDLARWWKALLVAALALAGAWLYGKGRRDVRQDVKTKDTRHANTIHEKAADARVDAAVRDTGDGLRDDDGFRRD